MQRERWRTIEELFQAALERRPEDRAAFMDQACAQDGALRHEVESLLLADENATGLVEPGAPFGHLLQELRARTMRSLASQLNSSRPLREIDVDDSPALLEADQPELVGPSGPRTMRHQGLSPIAVQCYHCLRHPRGSLSRTVVRPLGRSRMARDRQK